MESLIATEVRKSIALASKIEADKDLLATVARVGKLCGAAIRSGGKVMFCGNGGSAADCQHLAAEIVGRLNLDRPAMAGLALTTDTSALTAIGNDFGFEQIFARQVAGLGRAGDVLVGITTSGNSKNVVAALRTARTMGIATVAMTGAARGAVADHADHWIAIPHGETQKIQEGHMMLGHIICALIEAPPG